MNTNLQSVIASANAAQTDIDGLNAQITALTQQIAALNNVSIFDALELTQAIVAGGSVANSTGNTGVAADAQSVPTTLCASRHIIPNGSYQDKYWFWELGADSTKGDYLYETRLMLPTIVDCNASQAVELDIEQRIATPTPGTVTIYNTGFQFDFAENQLRIWNRSPVNHGWLSISVLCPRWSAGVWHSVALKTHRDLSNVHYDYVIVDGAKIPIMASFPAILASKTECMNIAHQLDANSTGTAYTLYIDAVKFTAKGVSA